jgi:integrase
MSGNDSAANISSFSAIAGASAINCTEWLSRDDYASSPFSEKLSSSVQAVVTNCLSENTKRAYAADLAHFTKLGGCIPAGPAFVANYLVDRAATCKMATIARAVASISKAHRLIGAPDPCQAEIVKATMKGLRRSLGSAQREAKPVLKPDLFAMLEVMGDRPKDLRDKALLLIGFAGAFRRSELVALNVDDIAQVPQGIVITLRRSKTDQNGEGRKIGIPFGRTRWCPVVHLKRWLDTSGIEQGAVFRGVAKGGVVSENRLSGDAVAVVIKQRAAAAGFDPKRYAGHSLRAGMATSAAMAGASTWKIRQQTGHASEAMLSRYIRDGDLFRDNATATLL